MRKIAIFVEGQSELIFIRNILFHLFDVSRFSFVCLQLRANTAHQVPFLYTPPNADIHFQIINVGNDEKVLAVIREREEQLFQKGFVKIIGLRDMYSKTYHETAQGSIIERLNQRHIKETDNTIARMKNAKMVKFYFAIMELEAWWLGMYNLFSKIDTTLSPVFIENQLGYDLSHVDPQTTFYHPATEVDKIFKLAGLRYGKHDDEVERITHSIDHSDIENATENNRCETFKNFCDELKRS